MLGTVSMILTDDTARFQAHNFSQGITMRRTIKLYYHKTDGGAQYMTDKYIVCPNGHKEGIFEDAEYIVRLDGSSELIFDDESQELLAALERCADVIGSNNCSDGKTPNGFVVALEHARKAIAKAKRN